MNSNKITVYIDGGCNFCQRTGAYIRRNDKHKKFEISTLDQLTPSGDHPTNSVIVNTPAGNLSEGDAVLFILRNLNLHNRLLAHLLNMFPSSWLNWGYRFVAKHRHRIFGKDVCRAD